MKPLVVFPDATTAGVRILRAALEGRTEPYAAGATVGARVPAERSDDDPHLPHVMVADDGGPTRYPVNARVTLRVTVWHHDDEQALQLAQLCLGLLHAVGHGHGIRSIPGNGSSSPITTIDPASKVDLATFTVAANVRPTPVA